MIQKNPHRQPLRYYGSKWRIGPWIASHHPPHYGYISVCGGGANDIFTKPPSKVEVYNDLDNIVVTFFRVLRDRTEELVKAIELTPYARAELNQSNETFAASGGLEPHQLDELELARRFFVHCQQGRSSGSSVWKTTWRYLIRDGRDKTLTDNWNELEHLYATAGRLKNCQIECKPALELIACYDDPKNLFYIDPPYLHNSRHDTWLKAYRYEWTEADHIEMAQRLQAIEGMAIISGYPTPLYDDLYTTRGWKMKTITARTNANSARTEAIWLSPSVQKQARQLPLFNQNAQNNGGTQ